MAITPHSNQSANAPTRVVISAQVNNSLFSFAVSIGELHVRWPPRFTVALGLAAALAWLAPGSAQAINKCTGADGKVTFQDAPCAGRGEVISVKPASGSAPGAATASKPTAPPATAAAPPPTAAAPSPTTPAVQPKTQLDAEADMCLAWYKPLLRDPLGAYYTEARRERRVVHITLHGTNGYGGYVTKQAACEIYAGKLNEAWTKNHARTAGWGVD